MRGQTYLTAILGVLFLATLIVSLVSLPLRRVLSRNRAALGLFEAIVLKPSNLPQSELPVTATSIEDCRQYWLRGLASQVLGQDANRDHAWEASLFCSPEYISLLSLLTPQQREWALASIEYYPFAADSWLWLAHTYLDPTNPGVSQPLAESDLAKIIPLYEKALQIAPYDGIAWRELGDLLAESDPQAAIEAYLNSCYNGDPGSNGCYRAGLTAESLGAYQDAIDYYRMSRWAGAHEKADQLENLR